jgi:hypothetical protein
MIYYEIKCIKFNFRKAILVSVNMYTLYAFSVFPNFVFFVGLMLRCALLGTYSVCIHYQQYDKFYIL